ncbi:hypothetical protein WJX81_008335 [Elliptochloris bilobata]|uniref:protein-serine/threonine phosphatase n=1 Tax=Elliptochloris bilobata TaxID=381761 RepID=A0AAW1QHE0_9CHLO
MNNVNGAFLPVFDYGIGSAPAGEHECRKSSQAAAGKKLPAPLSDQRARAVFTVMERLLEPGPASAAELEALAQPMSGEELLQVAEERMLAGRCGEACCGNAMRQPAGRGIRLDAGQQRLARDGDVLFCSAQCELRARRLAARLGTPEAALLRFMDARERLQRSQAASGVTPTVQAARAEPKFAAGREGTPIMLSQVKERLLGQERAPALAAQQDASKAAASSAAQRKEAAGGGEAVLVFEVQDPAGPLDAGEGVLGAQFGELKIADAGELGLAQAQLRGLEAARSAGGPAAGMAAELLLWREHLAAREDSKLDEALPALAPNANSQASPEAMPEDAAGGSEAAGDGKGSSWLAEPPEGFHNEPSSFGRLFVLVDGWVTASTLAFLAGEPHELPRSSAGNGLTVEVRRALERLLARQVVAALAGLRRGALRGAVEPALGALLGTLHLSSAIPSLSDGEWQLVTLALLRGLAETRVPALLEAFEGREALDALGAHLANLGASADELWALMEAVLPAD